jgi:preprotein translocase subunit SecG
MVAEAKEKFSFITIYIFSAAFVICSLILSAIQHKMIRKHLHARKYI